MCSYPILEVRSPTPRCLSADAGSQLPRQQPGLRDWPPEPQVRPPLRLPSLMMFPRYPWEQRRWPRTSHVRAHLGRAHLGAGGCDRELRARWTPPEQLRRRVPARMALRRLVPHRVPVPRQAEIPLPFSVRFPLRAPAPHRNRRAVKEEAPVAWPLRSLSFCGVVSARASICACQACNTDRVRGAIRQPGPRTTDVRVQALPDLLESLPWPVRFPLQFKTRNTFPSRPFARTAQPSRPRFGLEKKTESSLS